MAVGFFADVVAVGRFLLASYPVLSLVGGIGDWRRRGGGGYALLLHQLPNMLPGEANRLRPRKPLLAPPQQPRDLFAERARIFIAQLLARG